MGLHEARRNHWRTSDDWAPEDHSERIPADIASLYEQRDYLLMVIRESRDAQVRAVARADLADVECALADRQAEN